MGQQLAGIYPNKNATAAIAMQIVSSGEFMNGWQ